MPHSGGVDPLGNRQTLTDLLGQHTFGYDTLNRLTSATQPTLPADSFTYDGVGNRLTASSSQPSAVSNYTYDAANRLLDDGTFTYTYDNNGNRLTAISNQPSAVSNYIYDAANRLLDDGLFTYTYDANGNRTAQTDKATSQTATYAYDIENQLTRIDFPDATFAAYTYDALGRRIQKTVNGTVTRYVYDHEDILQEYDETNTLRAKFTHGPGIDEPLIMERDVDLNGSLEARIFYHTDGLGSTVALTNTSGAVVERYRYESFGQPTILGPGPDGLMDTADDVTLSCSAYGNPYLFTGREYDCESGLYFYRARYYDPKTGRFLQEDPVNTASLQLPEKVTRFSSALVPSLEGLLKHPQFLNLNMYVVNNPTNRTDPHGELSTADTILILAALIIAARLLAKASEFVVKNLLFDTPLKIIKKELKEMAPELKEHKREIEEMGKQMDEAFSDAKKNGMPFALTMEAA
ncbi:MAG: RHS repeat-associated core domain-containing protein [Candidatus Omnitrophica bacterium]|nr:RHS repeat-associated core domain-containing protein [Candidatus Omnitrophota bacterium]